MDLGEGRAVPAGGDGSIRAVARLGMVLQPGVVSAALDVGETVTLRMARAADRLLA